MPKKSLEERFWEKVDKSGGPEACWPWIGSLTNGYGQFTIGRKKHFRSHRVAYELTVGPISENMDVSHTCGDRSCTNSRHLILLPKMEATRRGSRKIKTNAQRLKEILSRINPEEQSCVEWPYVRHLYGYGIVRFNNGNFLAHRLAWIFTNGIISASLNVCHKCDNPPCINPNHLFLGTHADNMADMALKKRHWTYKSPHKIKRGENHKMSKLSTDDVSEIRLKYAKGGITQRELAKKYNITQSTIYTITTRKTWVHI